MKWSKGWEPRFRLHIGFFHSLLGRRLMVAQRENKGRLTPRCSRLAFALLRRAAERNRLALSRPIAFYGVAIGELRKLITPPQPAGEDE
jgi:hypothetical protein